MAVSSTSRLIFGMTWLGAALYATYFFLTWAYKIRLQAIEEFGPVIHEFDPYFNYRATEYLHEHGAKKFFTWFDYMAWYPLGRPVGTTIYPGMQFTAVGIKKFIVGDRMSLNDVCCYMPAWFGAFASFLVGCIAYECSLPQNTRKDVFHVLMEAVTGKKLDEPKTGEAGIIFGLSSPSLESAVIAMGVMGIVPAHLMRSIGGGYDNESVAVSAMCLTFYLWVRSLRQGDDYSYMYGILTGVAYFYMVAAWGGYIFVLNMIGVHAATLVLIGRFSTKVYLSYSLFYAIGTVLAIQIPVVGWTPVRSLEQLGPCVVFLGFQVLQFCETYVRKQKFGRKEAWKFRVKICSAAAIAGLIFAIFLMPKGYLGPMSSRVRGLFVKHTRTGNPLVDSVAEHQPASSRAYFQYLHYLCGVAPIGFVVILFKFGDAPSFLLVYATAAYFFSHKMVRLVLLTAPISSVLGAISIAHVVTWCVRQLWDESEATAGRCDDLIKPNEKDSDTTIDARKKKGKKTTPEKTPLSNIVKLKKTFYSALSSPEGVVVKRISSVIFLAALFFGSVKFKDYCWSLSQGLSNPSIILKGQKQTGEIIKVDDYREAYWWLRDNTPADSRILAWWDYGYQITAIANRTTIADGNTWNHEHIALLGKVLTSPVEEGYLIARHLADYVLLWGGGGGDDLAKSPHLARIANSVYRDMCPGDPTCRAFGVMDSKGTPSLMMRESFLYHLHGHGLRPGVTADPSKFREVYRSHYGKVRIYKLLGIDEESKAWVADPKNRVCDVEGGWFCKGQYPPALQDVVSKKKDFAQLEDFNRGKDDDDDYQKQYFENLADPSKAKAKVRLQEQERERQLKEQSKTTFKPQPSKEEIDAVYNKWENTEETTLMWSLINDRRVDDVESWLRTEPLMAYLRSADGRGPMWWAFESRNQDIVKVLMKYGVKHTDKDASGKTPVDLLEKKKG